jgi:tRNA (guanine37-N1)-methyltransferase
VRIDVVTLFPDFVRAAAGLGVIGRAQQRGLLEIATFNPREFAGDNYRTVDDRPYGGGPGMVMLIAPLRAALAAARSAAPTDPHVVLLSPQGARLTQRRVEVLARLPRLALICGRYEGIDERFIEAEVDEELSLGDFVLSGGELPAAVLIDAIGRLLEGTLGNAASAAADSFSTGLLDCPHYSRPEREGERSVPAVLLSGDHQAIRRWRLKQALGRTWRRRPDLLAAVELDAEARRLLAEYLSENPPNQA